jgi:hypothetical protein
MSLKSAKAEIKSKNLPAPFAPRNAPGGVVAINCNSVESLEIPQIMANHGYRFAETFYGVDTDYQLTFVPMRRR